MEARLDDVTDSIQRFSHCFADALFIIYDKDAALCFFLSCFHNLDASQDGVASAEAGLVQH